MTITTTYSKVEDELLLTLKDIAGSLFKFQLDLSFFVSNVCVYPDMTPFHKAVLKLLIHPLLFAILITIASIAQLMKRREKVKWIKVGQKLSTKTASGMMFAMLFSYQSIASLLFSLIYCVDYQDTKVLFLNGNIECYQAWQVITVFVVCVCVIPFSFYIMLAPAKLVSGTLAVPYFFASCLCAPPLTLLSYLKKTFPQCTCAKHRNPHTSTSTAPTQRTNRISIHKPSMEALAVYKILQGPYREYGISVFRRHIILCWSGMLLGRRLLLILCHTFIQDLVLRVSPKQGIKS